MASNQGLLKTLDFRHFKNDFNIKHRDEFKIDALRGSQEVVFSDSNLFFASSLIFSIESFVNF